MNDYFQTAVLSLTGASSLTYIEEIQSLWSGYGAISRYGLDGADRERVVIKHVKLPDQSCHPQGWNTDLSHQRKIKSYQVESAWYRDYSEICDSDCRVPECIGVDSNDGEFLMVLEDLDASGYSRRVVSATLDEMKVCLNWLANFHARFMGALPTSLWEVGTYWHLDTRPDEFDVLDEGPLKAMASSIDERLRASSFQTLVHGDAKLANFCFSENSRRVAAVDFQYVGGGCGMKDVAYFIGSCLHEEDCERYESVLLDSYFDNLRSALISRNVEVDPYAVERAWRPLFPVAWTDFHRFLKGWSPGHWKIHGYSERLSRHVLNQFSQLKE